MVVGVYILASSDIYRRHAFIQYCIKNITKKLLFHNKMLSIVYQNWHLTYFTNIKDFYDNRLLYVPDLEFAMWFLGICPQFGQGHWKVSLRNIINYTCINVGFKLKGGHGLILVCFMIFHHFFAQNLAILNSELEIIKLAVVGEWFSLF